MNRDKTIKLNDGRRLAYCEYGDKNGKPVFYFHGWPSSRLAGKETDEEAKKLGIRIISPDRPGFGLSDFKENRTLLDWPNDVEELANKLKIKNFAVVGVSGGGPYAAACAYKLSKRITKVGIVVGLSPTHDKKVMKGTFWMYAWSWLHYHKYPFLMVVASYMAQFEYKTMPAFGKWVGFQAKEDREVLKTKSLESLKESFRQGVKGSVSELKAFTDDWSFELNKIKLPVFLWYGQKDKNVSVEMGKYYHAHIPHSQLFIDSNNGHLGRLKYWDKILKRLA